MQNHKWDNRPVSGQLSYPVHAKVIENDSDDYKGHVRLKLLGMAPDESDAPETQWVRLLTPMEADPPAEEWVLQLDNVSKKFEIHLNDRARVLEFFGNRKHWFYILFGI